MKYLLVVQLYGNLSITTATSEINETVESMSRFLTTNRNIELLEPYEGKLSRTVLRGEGGSNALDLPDIKVADDNLYKEHIISRSDRTDYVVFRTLVLRAFKANGQYAEGTTWEIPEHELDRALATHRKQDASFRQRIKKAAMYLSPADAEAIIRLATYGIVRLELVIPPVPVREKPYYL